MSASSAAVAALGVPAGLDRRSRQVLRYAVGTTLAMAVAMGLDWTLAYITPVLARTLLASPAGRPTWKVGIQFVTVVVVAGLAGLVLSNLFLSYVFVYLPFAALVLLHLFHAQWSGRPPLLILALLLESLLIPFISIQSPALAGLVALSVIIAAVATLIIVWIAYILFPDLPAPIVRTAKAALPLPPPAERFRHAVQSTLVVFPVLAAFYVFQWTGAILVMVFVAMLTAQPSFAEDFEAGKALILGNVMGGLAAIVVYELLVLTPLFSFLIAIILLTGLVFGSRLFSDRPTAPLYGMAFSTVLLVIGSTTSGSGEAGAKVYMRVIQIMTAVVYVVVVSGVINHFWPRGERGA